MSSAYRTAAAPPPLQVVWLAWVARRCYRPENMQCTCCVRRAVRDAENDTRATLSYVVQAQRRHALLTGEARRRGVRRVMGE